MRDTAKNGKSSSARIQLENYLRAKVQVSAPAPACVPSRNKEEIVPLSSVQEQVWVHAQMAPDVPLYNEPVTIHYNGPMDNTALERAFNEILRRHESWRTSFNVVNGRPIQVVHPELVVHIPVTDLRRIPERDREKEAVRIATADAVVPLDLTEVPLFRARLIQLDDETHRLYLTLSHIIFDGVAIYRVFLPELAALYKAFAAGLSSPLPELRFQYPDLTCWQQRSDQSTRFSQDIAYWRKQLAGDLPTLDLPADRSRPPLQSFRGSMYPWVVSASLMSGIKALSQREGVTLFQTLLAAFAVLLKRYSGQDDIPIGSVTSGRNISGSEALLGYFLNTVVLRLDLSGDITFRDLLIRARNVTIEALAHDSVPLAHLIKELRIRRDPSRNPVFQTMFTLEPPIPVVDPQWQLSQMDIDTGATKYDLYLELDERRDGILARFHYSTDIFDRTTIERMAEQWMTLLESVVSAPEKRLHELPVLPAHQRQKLLVEWNSTEEQFPARTIHELFEREADNSPDATALEFENRWLTYADLNTKANKLARHLRTLGAKPGELIGLCVERSIEMVVGLLAILKAGAAYIPLDPAYPEERLNFIVDDAKPLLIVSDKSVRCRFPQAAVVVSLDSEEHQDEQANGANLDETVSPRDLAYVIYTSGSTGRPKGVQVEHRNVVNFLTSMKREPGITAKDVVAALTTMSFDIAALEIYLPLVTGARVLIVPTNVARDGRRLRQVLHANDVTMIQATPSTWRMLVESGWEGSPQLKILCGGEPLAAELADELLQRCGSLWNLYGPTETTIWSLANRLGRSTENAVSIGRPIANTKVYILDDHFNPVPIGITGEICIAGEGVARGYLNRPDLTADRFGTDPFDADPQARLYRTGDLGRYRSNGEIECLGRTDTQVKIRGYRVELGEIESALAKHPGLKAAVASVHEIAAGNPRLIAHIVTKNDDGANPEELRDYLREILPEYMIPSQFIVVDQFPLTPNGKVDRKALVPPDPNSTRTAEVVPPRDKVEAELVRIWEDVLSVRPVGVTDDFFALGGHSILAVRLFAAIEDSFHKSIPLAALLKAPTISQLANVVRGDGRVYKWTSLVPFETRGMRSPLFCVHGHYGEVLFYRQLAQYVGRRRPFYAFQAVATNGRPAYVTIQEMAAHYIAEMRQACPHGPYAIAGYCFGSLIAFEMAQRLIQNGEEVAFLGLFMGYESHAGVITRLGSRLRRHLEHLRKDGFTAKLSDVRFNLRAKLKSILWRAMNSTCRRWISPASRFFRNVPEMNLLAAKHYRPEVYPGKMTVFLSGDIPANFTVDPSTDLHGLTAAQIELKVVPGNQHTMLHDPHVHVLAAELDNCLGNTRKTAAKYRFDPSHP